jgi:hypothetical protein
VLFGKKANSRRLSEKVLRGGAITAPDSPFVFDNAPNGQYSSRGSPSKLFRNISYTVRTEPQNVNSVRLERKLSGIQKD